MSEVRESMECNAVKHHTEIRNITPWKIGYFQRNYINLMIYYKLEKYVVVYEF